MGQVTLQKPSKVLHGLARQTLNVLEQFTRTLVHQGNSTRQTVFVVRSLKSNLLGLPTITSLQLLYRANGIHSVASDIRKQFPKVFSGLDNLGEEYQIKLKEGAVLHALYTPNNVPIPMCGKVKEELDRMMAMGVILPVHDQTQWSALR